MGKELSIIIVDYKSSDFIIKLISDLSKHLSNLTYEVRVVDNNPKGTGAKKITRAHHALKNLKIIKAKKNLGFGAGNNLGAKAAKGKYLLFLNPDIKIIDNSIERMLDFMVKHAEIGALTCLLYQPTFAKAAADKRDGKTLQRHFFGDFQNFAGITIKRWRGREVDLSKDFFYTDMVTGAALMIRRNLFEKLGGFDEHFFMYIEDDDLCYRLKNLGYKNAVLTTARLIHYEGQSSTSLEKKKYYYQSQNYYWQKHYGRFQTALMKILRYPYILWQKIQMSRLPARQAKSR